MLVKNQELRKKNLLFEEKIKTDVRVGKQVVLTNVAIQQVNFEENSQDLL